MLFFYYNIIQVGEKKLEKEIQFFDNLFKKKKNVKKETQKKDISKKVQDNINFSIISSDRQ